MDELITARELYVNVKPVLICLLLLLPVTVAAAIPDDIRPDSPVYDAVTNKLTINCILNSGYPGNGLAPAFAARLSAMSPTMLRLESVQALGSVPADCYDDVSFTFTPTGTIATLQLRLADVWITSLEATYTVRLASDNIQGLQQLRVESMQVHGSLLPDLSVSSGDQRAVVNLYGAFNSGLDVTLLDERQQPIAASSFTANIDSIVLPVTFTGSRSFYLSGNDTAGKPVLEKITIQVCLPTEVSSGSYCEQSVPDSTVCDGPVTIQVPSDIAGLANCRRINRDLTINNVSGLTDLTGLENLQEVGGTLSIANNPTLESLKGLSGLRTVYTLSITNNKTLRSITPLISLRSARSIEISQNTALTSLRGLDGLSSGGGLTLSGNTSLSDLHGLDNLSDYSLSISDNSLRSLAGLEQLRYASALYVRNEPFLMDVTGLYSLTSVDVLKIIGNPALLSLHGLENVREGSVAIESNANLTDVQALNGVTSLTFLDIAYNTSVRSLPAFENLGSLGGLYLVGMSALENFSGLGKITHIDNNAVTISENANLKTLTALSNLTYMRADLIIGSNPALTSLENFRNLATIDGSLEIGGNSIQSLTPFAALQSVYNLSLGSMPLVTNLDGFNRLETLGNLSLSEMSGLKDLTGLGSLTLITGNLIVSDMPALESMQGLNQLKQVRMSVAIQGDAKLVNLKGLDALASVGGRFDITEDASLVSLSGLNNLAEVSYTFALGENPQLATLGDLQNLIKVGDFYVYSDPVLSASEVSSLKARLGVSP